MYIRLFAHACCPSLLFYCYEKHNCSNFGIKELISSYSLYYIPPRREVKAGTQGSNLVAGTEAKAMDYTPWIAQFTFLHNPELLPNDGTPTSITNQGNAPGMTEDNLTMAFPQL